MFHTAGAFFLFQVFYFFFPTFYSTYSNNHCESQYIITLLFCYEHPCVLKARQHFNTYSVPDMNPGPGKTAIEVKSAVQITIVNQKDRKQDIMAEEQEIEILKETQLTTPTDDADTTTEKKRPGPINPIQVAAFVTATTTSIDKFVTTIHNYESYTLQSCYETLIDEYYQELIKIEDYFKDADKNLVLDLVDDKTCKIIRVETQKDSEDRKRCPDPCISTPNLMTGSAALTRLATLLNFEKIDGDDREKVCDLFDSLSTAHAAIADIAGNLATLGRRLNPTQFQFLLKHSVQPLVQLQVPARLCNPADLTFAEASLTDEEMFEQRAVNNILPRPYHPNLEAVDPKHPT